MTIQVGSEKIRCKLCGSEINTHKYHLHVMAVHRD